MAHASLGADTDCDSRRRARAASLFKAPDPARVSGGSMRTVPVNHSTGPLPDGCVPFRLISIALVLWWCRRDSFNEYHNRNPSRFCRWPLLKYNVGGLIMTKLDDAERKIIREWDAWASSQSDPVSLCNGFPFYRHLLKERSELLKFRYTGDRWQRVYGCLLRAGRVKE
jgi:hypothetical protein